MKTLLEKNILIASFLGWEVTDNTFSQLKKRGMQFAEIPDGFFKIHKNDLQFDKSMDLLIRAFEKIKNSHFQYANYDIHEIIKYLLNGGYIFYPHICHEKLEFSVENLFDRIILFLESR